MVDLTIDFNALLEEAKAQRKVYEDTVELLKKKYVDEKYLDEKTCYSPEIQAEINAAFDKWMDWCQKNIYDRGLELNCNMRGIPVGISACLAGHR